MHVILLTKKEKPGVRDAVELANVYFKNLVVCYGKIKDELPPEIIDKKYDLIISYLSPWIVPKEILERTIKWNINFHPGPPEFPGIGCFNFAIYKSVKQFGATAHIMEPKVDTGEIIGVKHFSMTENETVETLSKKTYAALLSLYKDIIDYIVANHSLPKSDETWKRNPYKRKELEDLATISENMSKQEIDKRIRATYYPGKPAPYIELFGYRFEYKPDR